MTSFDVVCGRRTHTLTIDGTRGAVDLGELRLSQALEALTLLVAAAREAGADTLAVYTEGTVYSLPLAVTEES